MQQQVINIGKHSVTQVSIENPLVDSLLQGCGGKVDILYSDPPWGDGNMKYWVTLNKKMTSEQFQPLTFDQLINRFVDIIQRYVHGHVFLETGVRWAEMLQSRLGTVTVAPRIYTLKYQSGARMLANVLIHGVTPGVTNNFTYDPSGGIGQEVARKCISSVAKADGIVCDPCCGMGYTAQAAIDAQMRFVGNEFNKARLAKTIARLEKTL